MRKEGEREGGEIGKVRGKGEREEEGRRKVRGS